MNEAISPQAADGRGTRVDRQLAAMAALAGAWMCPAPATADLMVFTTPITVTDMYVGMAASDVILIDLFGSGAPYAKSVFFDGLTSLDDFLKSYPTYELLLSLIAGAPTPYSSSLYYDYSSAYTFYWYGTTAKGISAPTIDYTTPYFLSAGVTIGPALPWTKSDPGTPGVAAMLAVSAFYGDAWYGAGKGYAGFKVVVGGSSYYGWLSITEISAASLYEITLHAIAIETTAGTSVVTGVVPEPGSFALATLALGASGVVAARRRRREQAAPGGQLGK